MSNSNGSQSKKPDQPSLDDVLVALQKSFSRVSTRTADVDPEMARAMISGQVAFNISLKAELEGDYLLPNDKGSLDLNLSGTLETDIRTDEDE